MDTTHQSSFIPKKPSSGGTFSQSGGLFPFITNTIFTITIIASIGVFAYDKYLQNNISAMDSRLNAARTELQPETIKQLVKSDKRITAAGEIVNNHVTLSSFFELIQKLTLQGVRFTSFSYGPGVNNSTAIILKGYARTYATVALQAKIFSENENFANPLFSDLDLNEKGDVVFCMRTGINPKIISYTAQLEAQNQPAVIPTQNTQTVPTPQTASTTP